MARCPFMSPRSIFAALLVFGCAASPSPAPSTPSPSPSPDPAPAPEPDPQLEAGEAPAQPTPAPELTATSPKPDPAPAGKGCSIWSGGPKGDAPPPKGYDPNPCGPKAHCECGAQAGYSCSGVCQPN